MKPSNKKHPLAKKFPTLYRRVEKCCGAPVAPPEEKDVDDLAELSQDISELALEVQTLIADLTDEPSDENIGIATRIAAKLQELAESAFQGSSAASVIQRRAADNLDMSTDVDAGEEEVTVDAPASKSRMRRKLRTRSTRKARDDS